MHKITLGEVSKDIALVRPQALTPATAQSASVDVLADDYFDEVELIIELGTQNTPTAPTFDLAVQESSDDGVGDAFAQAVDKNGDNIAITQQTASDQSVRLRFNPGALERYWRIEYTVAGVTDWPVAIVAKQANPNNPPA